MELDINIPSLDLAFEYNGYQHYHHSIYYGPCDKQKRRDKRKMEQCVKAEITLIVIPYWWNQKPDSLKATIHAVRPDLVESPGSDVHPIAPDPPPGEHVSRQQGICTHILSTYTYVTAVLACKFMNPSPWEGGRDPTNWYVGGR